MRIAFLTSEYITEGYYDGGLAHYLHRVVLGMSPRGHEIEIFLQSDRDEAFARDGALIHRINSRYLPLSIFNRATRHRLSRVINVLVMAYNLRSCLLKRHRERPFDVVQAASYLACGLGLARNSPFPLVIRLSSFEPLWRQANREANTVDQRLVERLELYTLRHSSALYAPSRFIANIVHGRTGLRVDVIEPPFALDTAQVDESVFEQRLKGIRYLLFFGQICFVKGVAVLADALGAVLPNHPDMHLVLVGRVSRGPGSLSMLQYVARRAEPYADRVHYLGMLPLSQLYPVVANAQAVVLPSLVDNLPNTCLEAMALRQVVIGTRGASFDEVIEDGVSGVLVTPGSSTELADAIKRVWQISDAEKERLGHAAKTRVSLLAPDYTGAKLEEYFEGLLK